MLALVDSFCRRVDSYTAGGVNHRELIKHFNSSVDNYTFRIWSTAPIFEPFTAREKKAIPKQPVVEAAVDDDDDNDEDEDEDDDGDTGMAPEDDDGCNVDETAVDSEDDFDDWYIRKGCAQPEIKNLDDIRKHIKE